MASIFNDGSVLGHIIPNVLNTMAPTTLILAVTVYCMIGVANASGMIVLAPATGFLSGVVVALPPMCFRVPTEDKSMIGTRIGRRFAMGGLGLLSGGPSADALLGRVEAVKLDQFVGVFVFGVVRVMKA